MATLALACAAAATAAAAADNAVDIGLGRYYTRPRPGTDPADATPPPATLRTREIATRAAPTNQWYSAVMFGQEPTPIYAQPMTYRLSRAGVELGLPDRQVIATPGLRREIRYAHVAAITVSPLGFTPVAARLAGYSDWLARLQLDGASGQSLQVAVLHGSPFSYFSCTSGDVRFQLHGSAEILADPGRGDPRVVAVAVDGHAYALFAPSGSSWHVEGANELVLHLGARARYFSVAGLPDRSTRALPDFLAHAYAFPVSTRVDWSYDEHRSRVRSRFRIDTIAMEGSQAHTFLGLYPHHVSGAAAAVVPLFQYDSVRGPIRLIEGNEFTLERDFHGVLPAWPALSAAADRSAVDSLLAGDVARTEERLRSEGAGPYWTGKWLAAGAQLLEVAAAERQSAAVAATTRALEVKMQRWFSGSGPGYFLRNDAVGTLVGVPEEYRSISNMNDHHFQYGYWLMAATHLALHDPDWASESHWGGMVGRLIADIATDERERSDYPFLRNFDSYEGHSWASGTGALDDGNNQESSSEAVNAWAALVLWGEITGNRRLRDLGIYLYTSEIAALEQYWFDLPHQVLSADLERPFASLVFGGKYVYGTWWTEEPRQILGINLLPFTPASTYLAADPSFVRRALEALPAAVRAYAAHPPGDGTPADVWQDELASYRALVDPAAALASFDVHGSVEAGDTRARTLYWLLSLREMGSPDFSVSADTPLYAVFRAPSGARTYLAYNAHATALHVTFSSGATLDVAPHSLGRGR